MEIQEPAPDRGPSGTTPNWKKVLLYLGLVVFIVGLNYLSTRNAPQKKPAASAKASATANGKTAKSEKSNNQAGTVAHDSAAGQRSPDRGSNRSEEKDGRQPTAKSKSTSRDEIQSPANDDDDLIARNMRIRDEDGRVIYSGDVDLRPTLDRIERGKRLRFPNDGVVFENRERRLPSKSSGYYHEYVLPTRGDDGPGPQRIVMGSEGEVYYTPDHYKSFRRVK